MWKRGMIALLLGVMFIGPAVSSADAGWHRWGRGGRGHVHRYYRGGFYNRGFRPNYGYRSFYGPRFYGGGFYGPGMYLGGRGGGFYLRF